VSKGLASPGDALRAGFFALLNVLRGLLVVLLFLLPFIPVVALAWWVIRGLARRYRARHPVTDTRGAVPPPG
ncbi:MAG: hypothetical protein QOG03_1600, partial [Actinomycetota bacterium]|jgi:hypothetical protein|nr:hypothetical protein [Actinomycetota bacterium]